MKLPSSAIIIEAIASPMPGIESIGESSLSMMILISASISEISSSRRCISLMVCLSSSAFAELWIDQYNNVVASPIVYGNDNIQIVKWPSLPLIYVFSNPSVLMEIDLAEKIDLDQDFISLFNKIYEYKHKK